MRTIKLYLALFFAYAFTLSAQAQVLAPDVFQKGITSKDVQLLDVRTAGEYKNGHIKNSLQADWNNQDQFKDRIQYVDKSKPVYVYCAAGGRSSAAAKYMRENGFADVKELKGGIAAWNGEHLPTVGMAGEEQITLAAFAAMTKKSPVVLVDFGAPWCPPCVKMLPVIARLEKDLAGKFQTISLDPTVQVSLANELKIETLPTFLIYKNGKEVFRKQGIASYDELKTSLLH
ncbi:MAG: rhodanese-like domain-containing protein [Chitinophagaceae bacterium]